MSDFRNRVHMYHLLCGCYSNVCVLLQKLFDVAPSSSEGSTVDLRHVVKKGEDVLDFELEESTEPEACFTTGDSANSLFTILRLVKCVLQPSTITKKAR